MRIPQIIVLSMISVLGYTAQAEEPCPALVKNQNATLVEQVKNVLNKCKLGVEFGLCSKNTNSYTEQQLQAASACVLSFPKRKLTPECYIDEKCRLKSINEHNAAVKKYHEEVKKLDTPEGRGKILECKAKALGESVSDLRKDLELCRSILPLCELCVTQQTPSNHTPTCAQFFK